MKRLAWPPPFDDSRDGQAGWIFRPVGSEPQLHHGCIIRRSGCRARTKAQATLRRDWRRRSEGPQRPVAIQSRFLHMFCISRNNAADDPTVSPPSKVPPLARYSAEGSRGYALTRTISRPNRRSKLSSATVAPYSLPSAERVLPARTEKVSPDFTTVVVPSTPKK